MTDRPRTAPPESWAPARRIARTVLRPIERFLHVEAASGIVLLVAAAVAFLWANSPWAATYDALWHTPLTLGLGGHVLKEPLEFWINEGLMTVFFLVVGLEIRREVHEGELADWKRAALPVAAALGGMAVPALLYLAFNQAPEVRRGWGIPTATDIAFALGVLALLGKRVPPALRVLLLALAIIDDIGAILVIAIFYSQGIDPVGLVVAGGGLAGIALFQSFGIRLAWLYILPAGLVWVGMWMTGVHPTIAGVLVGLATPVRPWFGSEGFLTAAGDALKDFRKQSERDEGTHGLMSPLQRIREAHREALSPVVRIQTQLHPWVAYGIMPLFAFANAGVSVGGLELEDRALTVFSGAAAGLVLGKPLGILIASWLAVKTGVAALPRGVTWMGVLLVGCVGGIGFTMALFIASLAFEDVLLLASAKLAVLISSVIAAILGLVVGRLAFAAVPPEEPWATAAQAEASAQE